MRLTISAKTGREGSALLVALSSTVLIALAIGVYLRLTVNQNQLAVRSEIWNACMPVLEAGIEDALAHCSFNSTNMASNGWNLSAGRYRRTNWIGQTYYEVSISTNQPFDVVSKGAYPLPGTSTYVTRTVQVTTQMDPEISGIVARVDVAMNGNGVRVDSYDSRDPAKSTNGQYDPAKAGDKADVACLTPGNTFNTGNGDIWGHALVYPGGSVKTGANGSVGGVDWHRSGKSGVQPGWSRTDLNRAIPPVTVPFASGVVPLSGKVDGINYDSIFDGGNFIMPTLDNKVAVIANSSVYVLGKINCNQLLIKKNAGLKIYCAGPSAHFAQVDNENGTGPSLMFYGLPTLTSIQVSQGWGGGIYAPEAPFSLGGNGEVCGALVAKSLSLKGTSAFHYDEAFSSTNARAWVISSWTEQ